MNKVIKYKAWDKKKNRWLTDHDEVYLDSEGSAFILVRGAASDYLSQVDVDIVFFTGITDANGQEIYEGDCDAVGNVVEFLDGSFCLNGDRPLTSRFIKAGNRFENPEFL